MKSLDIITRKHPQTGIFLAGDFNHMKDTQIKTFPLKQIVKFPTHGNSILDCVYTNMSEHYRKPEGDPGLGLSHHSVVLVKPGITDTNREQTTFMRRVNKPENQAGMIQDLKDIKWEDLYRNPTCLGQYEMFVTVLSMLMDSHLPLEEITRKETDKPWITDEFKRLISKRQAALRKGNKMSFRFYRNKVNKMSKRLRRNFYQKQIEGLSRNNPKDWWKRTKALLGIKKSNGIKDLANIANEKYGGNNGEMIRNINTFLHSVSADLHPIDTSLVPKPEQVPEDYIISTEEVEARLEKIKVGKAPGPDGIPNWLLKVAAPLISGPVCAIFNSSIRESVVPQMWKSANVTPIAKIQNPTSIETDLRPISLTPVLGKQLEACMGCRIYDEIKEKLDSTQFGSIKGSSTTVALIDMLHHWHQAIHDKRSVRVVFIDFSKAFDLIDHTLLIRKFQELGLSPTPLAWLANFLSCRQQRVKLGQEVSEWLTLNGAMPQGSYLGPLSFIVYMHDMPQFKEVKAVKYIDDTTLAQSITGKGDDKTGTAIHNIVQWATENHMKLNSSKTKEMQIHFKRKPLDLEPLQIQGKEIEKVSKYKILGVTVNSNLTWNDHVSAIVSKASTRLYFMKQLRRSGAPMQDLLVFYKAVVRSLLEYACQTWHPGLTKEQIELIEKVQERAMRIMCPGDNIEQCREKTKLETLDNRRTKLCTELYKKIEKPSHKLHELLPARNNHQYWTQNTGKRTIAKIRNERYKKDFIVKAILEYQN